MSTEERNTVHVIFLTHSILLVVDKIVYATTVIHRLATRKLFRTLVLLRSARVLARSARVVTGIFILPQ
jgi:hypothetical protein